MRQATKAGRCTVSVGALVAALSAAGCGGVGHLVPTGDEETFRARTVETVESVAGTLAEVQVAADANERHDLPIAYVSVLVGEAESDARGDEETLTIIQPPTPAADDLRREALEVMGRAIDLLGEVRISIDRGDAEVLTRRRADLDAAVQALEDFADQHGGDA